MPHTALLDRRIARVHGGAQEKRQVCRSGYARRFFAHAMMELKTPAPPRAHKWFHACEVQVAAHLHGRCSGERPL